VARWHSSGERRSCPGHRRRWAPGYGQAEISSKLRDGRPFETLGDPSWGAVSSARRWGHPWVSSAARCIRWVKPWAAPIAIEVRPTAAEFRMPPRRIRTCGASSNRRTFELVPDVRVSASPHGRAPPSWAIVLLLPQAEPPAERQQRVW